MSLGPIPFTAVLDYFNIYELEDFEEFAYVMRRMDKLYLELNNGKVSSEHQKEDNSSGRIRDKKNSNQS